MMTLMDTRYWCFRFKTETEGGPSADEAPEGIRETYEASAAFGGWAKFGVTWDLMETEEGEKVITPLKESLWTAWSTECRKNAREVPPPAPDKTVRLKRTPVVEHLEIDAVLK